MFHITAFIDIGKIDIIFVIQAKGRDVRLFFVVQTDDWLHGFGLGPVAVLLLAHFLDAFLYALSHFLGFRFFHRRLIDRGHFRWRAFARFLFLAAALLQQQQYQQQQDTTSGRTPYRPGKAQRSTFFAFPQITEGGWRRHFTRGFITRILRGLINTRLGPGFSLVHGHGVRHFVSARGGFVGWHFAFGYRFIGQAELIRLRFIHTGSFRDGFHFACLIRRHFIHGHFFHRGGFRSFGGQICTLGIFHDRFGLLCGHVVLRLGHGITGSFQLCLQGGQVSILDVDGAFQLVYQCFQFTDARGQLFAFLFLGGQFFTRPVQFVFQRCGIFRRCGAGSVGAGTGFFLSCRWHQTQLCIRTVIATGVVRAVFITGGL